METFEAAALRNSSRGMNLIKDGLEPGYISRAAEKLLALERGNVILTTGFYVNGAAETDGPPGTLVVAKALEKLGFSPIIATDVYCSGLFSGHGIETVYADLNAGESDMKALLDSLKPCAMISIERCGKNTENYCGNCKGKDISAFTAPLDTLFELASERGIFTVGIGDGGNEIGMGKLKDMIAEKLGVKPCVVSCDELIVSTTSNMGAYALAAALEQQSGEDLLMSGEELGLYIAGLVAGGCVDGVSNVPEFKVDGADARFEMDLLDELHRMAGRKDQ